MKQRFQFLKSSAAMLALGAVQRLFGMLTTAALARLLSETGLAAYSVAQSVSQTSFGIARLGADAGLHVSFANLDERAEREQLEKLVGEALSLFSAIAVFVLATLSLGASEIAKTMFGDSGLAFFIQMGAIICFGQTMIQYCWAIMAGMQAFTRYSIVSGTMAAINLAMVTCGAALFGARGAATALALCQMLSLGSTLYVLLKELSVRNVRLRFRMPGPAAWMILRIGLPFYGGGLLMIPVDFYNLTLVGRLHGIDGLGEIRVIQALITIANLIPQSITAPLVSLLANRSGDKGVLTDRTQLAVRGTWSLCILIGIAMSAIWPLGLQIIAGGKFATARDIGQLAILSFVPMMLHMIFSSALLASQRTMLLFGIGIAQAMLSLVSSHFLIPEFGVGGFLLSQFVSYSFAAVTMYVSVFRSVPGSSRFIGATWYLLLVTMATWIVISMNLYRHSSEVTILVTDLVLTALILPIIVFKAVLPEERNILAVEGLALGRITFNRIATYIRKTGI